MKYRSEAMAYIKGHKDKFVQFIEDDKTIDQYLVGMAREGVWGG